MASSRSLSCVRWPSTASSVYPRLSPTAAPSPSPSTSRAKLLFEPLATLGPWLLVAILVLQAAPCSAAVLRVHRQRPEVQVPVEPLGILVLKRVPYPYPYPYQDRASGRLGLSGSGSAPNRDDALPLPLLLGEAPVVPLSLGNELGDPLPLRSLRVDPDPDPEIVAKAAAAASDADAETLFVRAVKRQVVRYHQCYFNPISCFGR